VPTLVAKPAGGEDVFWLVRATVAPSGHVLSRALQRPCGLWFQLVANAESVEVSEPHRSVAIEAATALAFESERARLGKGSMISGHERVLC